MPTVFRMFGLRRSAEAYTSSVKQAQGSRRLFLGVFRVFVGVQSLGFFGLWDLGCRQICWSSGLGELGVDGLEASGFVL